MVHVESLQKYALFGGLLPEEIESVRPHLAVMDLAAGDYVIREGEPNGRIHFILEGRVQVTRRGRELISFGEGDTFGEVEVMDVMPAVASIHAIGPTRLAVLSNRDLHELSKSEPRVFAMLMMNLARELARRLRRMDEMFCDQGSEPPDDMGCPPA